MPGTVPVKFTAVVEAPLHSVWLGGAATFAPGFTVMVKVTGVPVQVIPALVYTGVTVTVAVTGALLLLMAIKDGTVPVPPAARPMLILLLLQLYTVPPTGPAGVTAVVDVPLHNVWLAIAFTDGVGFTVKVNVTTVPGQPVNTLTGVTVTVATTGAVPVFTAMKLGIFPVPTEASPIDGWLLVQLKNTPGWDVVKLTGAVLDPLHSTWLPGSGGSIAGVGFTVIVKVFDGPVQPTPLLLNVGVTVIVAVTGKAVRLIAVKAAILPVPLAARPILVLLLVQA